MILPPPVPLAWRPAPGGPALVLPALESVAPHLFTTRPWRLGRAAAAGGDDRGWAEVAEAIGVERDALVRVDQVHGNIAVIAEPGVPRCCADIILNTDPNVAIAVQTADCAPLLYADLRTGAVAAAHAGWRGLAARVPETAVASLASTFGSRAEDLVVVLGPSIGACCYEVGVDVRDAFTRAGFGLFDIERWFRPRPMQMLANPSMDGVPAEGRSGHWFFDPWASARDQLQAAGVLADRIFSSELCTASHIPVFCSYRRDGSPAGRMAAAIKPGRRP